MMAAEQTEQQLREREVFAWEQIGRGLEAISRVMAASLVIEQKRFDRDYPARKEVRDATITHRQTEEERLRESQGASGEPDEAWSAIGRREAEAILDEEG